MQLTEYLKPAGKSSGRAGLLLLVGLLPGASVPADTPPAFRLDVANGVGGVPFGAPVPTGATTRFVGFGRRWKTTRVYTRPNDSTRLHGIGTPTDYWFRDGRFEGVQVRFEAEAEMPRLLTHLTQLYGPPRPDTVPGNWYWLGQRSFVLLERSYLHGALVELASLDMLNEQVYETALRSRARRQLGWRPDAIGLPQQYSAAATIEYARKRAKKEKSN